MAINASEVSFSYRARVRSGSGPLGRLFGVQVRRVPVLDSVSLSLDRSGVVGILGKNGAGKTTLIKILCGLLEPEAGSVEVNGFVPFKKQKAFLSGIGVMFGHRSALWPDLSLLENLELFAAIYGHRFLPDRAKSLISQFALEDMQDRPAKTFSLGQTVKANLAAHLQRQPPLLILDEPTVGLDVESQATCREAIVEYASGGSLVVLTTHNMMDIAKTCSSVYFLRDCSLRPVDLEETQSAAARVESLERLFL